MEKTKEKKTVAQYKLNGAEESVTRFEGYERGVQTLVNCILRQVKRLVDSIERVRDQLINNL